MTDAQNIRHIIENTLTFYDVSFKGWSSLARTTCLKYGLPDPLAYLKHPWRPDRWRAHCKKSVQNYWENELLNDVKNSETLKYVDVEYASLSIPMRVWQMAGLCSVSVRQATVQNWMMLGVYYTRVFLSKIKKVKTPICAGCNSKDEDLSHLLLHCRFYDPIREKYLSQYFVQNTSIGDILGNEDLMIQTILDPISAKLPDTFRNSWLSVKDAYKLSRQFCYDLHRKREKLYSEID